jgi:hypothetical protein
MYAYWHASNFAGNLWVYEMLLKAFVPYFIQILSLYFYNFYVGEKGVISCQFTSAWYYNNETI